MKFRFHQIKLKKYTSELKNVFTTEQVSSMEHILLARSSVRRVSDEFIRRDAERQKLQYSKIFKVCAKILRQV